MSLKSNILTLESFVFNAGPPGRSLVSFAHSLTKRRILHLSIDGDGDYINSQQDGVIVSPVLHRTDIRKVFNNVIEYWLFDYNLCPGNIVFDIGAGIGEDTLVFAKQVGPTGHVFSFEANPRTAQCLSKTTRLSGLENVETFAVAIAEHAGFVRISNEASHVQNSLFVTDSQDSIEVPAITLDDFVESNNIECIDLLKMNIEGAESPALLGFQKKIDCVKNVAIACHDWVADLGYNDSYRTLKFVQSFLESQRFSVKRRINDKRPWVRDTLLASRCK